MARICIYILLMAPFFNVSAQHYRRGNWSDNGISGKKSFNRKEKTPYSLTFLTGLTQFYGEMDGQDMQGLFGIGLGRALNKQFSLRLDYTAGRLGGEESGFFNAYFINDYNTFEFYAKWNLTEQFGELEPGDLHCSLYGGIGLMIFSANAFDISNNRLLRYTNSQLSARNPLFLRWGKPKGPPGIGKTHEGILPLGISLDYRLLKHWKIAFDFRFYLIRTDKADATSGRRLINPEEGESYSDTPNDKFSFLSVGLGFCF